MAKKGNDSFTPSGFNGGDPVITGRQFDDNKGYYKDVQGWNSNIGEGNQSGRQFQDSDDMYTLEGFNIIDSRDPNYAGSASGAKPERNSVDVSKSDRGREV